jgi:hypothetical protein
LIFPALLGPNLAKQSRRYLLCFSRRYGSGNLPGLRFDRTLHGRLVLRDGNEHKGVSHGVYILQIVQSNVSRDANASNLSTFIYL